MKLVPMLSLGEVDILDNPSMPTLQRWFLHRVGFAIPFSPYGVGYLPIPRPAQCTVVVGEPIVVPHVEHPTDKDIKKVLFRYISQLNGMFERHQHHIPGQESRKRRLVFLDHDEKKRDLHDFQSHWSLSDEDTALGVGVGLGDAGSGSIVKRVRSRSRSRSRPRSKKSTVSTTTASTAAGGASRSKSPSRSRSTSRGGSGSGSGSRSNSKPRGKR